MIHLNALSSFLICETFLSRLVASRRLPTYLPRPRLRLYFNLVLRVTFLAKFPLHHHLRTTSTTWASSGFFLLPPERAQSCQLFSRPRRKGADCKLDQIPQTQHNNKINRSRIGSYLVWSALLMLSLNLKLLSGYTMLTVVPRRSELSCFPPPASILVYIPVERFSAALLQNPEAVFQGPPSRYLRAPAS